MLDTLLQRALSPTASVPPALAAVLIKDKTPPEDEIIDIEGLDDDEEEIA